MARKKKSKKFVIMPNIAPRVPRTKKTPKTRVPKTRLPKGFKK
jgi:hypothetical protein